MKSCGFGMWLFELGKMEFLPGQLNILYYSRHSNGQDLVPSSSLYFLYSYEAEFIQSLLSTGKRQLASRFILTYRYIDGELSINNQEFESYLSQIYPAELEITDTSGSTTSASYLDLLLSNWRDGQHHTFLMTNVMISISTSQTFR